MRLLGVGRQKEQGYGMGGRLLQKLENRDLSFFTPRQAGNTQPCIPFGWIMTELMILLL